MQTITVRASSWGALFDCGSSEWEGVHLLKMRGPSSPRALLGTARSTEHRAFDAGAGERERSAPTTPAELLEHAAANGVRVVDWRGSGHQPERSRVHRTDAAPRSTATTSVRATTSSPSS
ncbi:hypothetical protein ACPA9J_00070 [Pseudomonas aeruginosa]